MVVAAAAADAASADVASITDPEIAPTIHDAAAAAPSIVPPFLAHILPAVYRRYCNHQLPPLQNNNLHRL